MLDQKCPANICVALRAPGSFHAALGSCLLRMQSGFQPLADSRNESRGILHANETEYSQSGLGHAVSELWARWRLQTNGYFLPGDVTIESLVQPRGSEDHQANDTPVTPLLRKCLYSSHASRSCNVTAAVVSMAFWAIECINCKQFWLHTKIDDLQVDGFSTTRKAPHRRRGCRDGMPQLRPQSHLQMECSGLPQHY
jgi:hypothetical protein